ncbi:MAG: DNA alkylation repair protein [Brevibacterium sp.]
MSTTAEVLEALAALEDPKIRAVNERHGDDHGVNLTKLRAVAKELKKNDELAAELWATGDTAARLVAILIMRPRTWDVEQLDAMLRESRVPKVHAWLVSYIVKKSPHAEVLRQSWFDDPDPVVASAGWALTSERVNRNPEGLDLPGLLDTIEAEMAGAEERLQWAMNETLSYIGIENPELRERAIAIGHRLGVLEDYPTPPGCTSPFAPSWIAEIVRRRSEAPPADVAG